MDDYGLSDRFCEMDENNFHGFDNEIYDAPNDAASCMDDGLSPVVWFDAFLNSPVLNDCMISEAACSPPFIKTEHSYSTYDDEQQTPCGVGHFDGDGAATAAASAQPAKSTEEKTPLLGTAFADEDVVIKSEPAVPAVIETRRSLLRQQHPSAPTLVCNVPRVGNQPRQQEAGAAAAWLASPGADRVILPKISITVETGAVAITTHTSSIDSPTATSMDDYSDSLPPTPPGSSSNSDSDGCGGRSLSRSPSPVSDRCNVTSSHRSSRLANPATAIFSQPIPTSGVLALTEEEKRTLASEGYPIPTKLPLTKQEERNLKKVRRKIKNKISAQESRRKKKEYVDTLERRVENLARENGDLRKKCDTFQTSNTSLVSQLRRLQSLVTKCVPGKPSPATAQAGTCLTVLALCFAVFVGNWSPPVLNTSAAPSFSLSSAALRLWSGSSHGMPRVADSSDAYTTYMKSSRTLMQLFEEHEILHTADYNEPAKQSIVSDLFANSSSSGCHINVGKSGMVDSYGTSLQGQHIARFLAGSHASLLPGVVNMTSECSAANVTG